MAPSRSVSPPRYEDLTAPLIRFGSRRPSRVSRQHSYEDEPSGSGPDLSSAMGLSAMAGVPSETGGLGMPVIARRYLPAPAPFIIAYTNSIFRTY